MSLVRMTAAALMLSLAVCGLATSEDKADPREKLETIIPLGIKQLEAKDYAKFLKTFVLPEDYEQITKNVSAEEFAKKFGEDNAAKLLKILKAIKDAKPTLDKDGSEATYDIKKEDQVNGKATIVFVKKDKFWYVRN